MIRQLIWVLAIGLVGCSAIELGEQNAQATAQAEAIIENTVASRVAEQLANEPTIDAITAQATNDAQAIETYVAGTVTAVIQQTPSPDSESTAEVTPDVASDFVAKSVNTSVYGTVPIDSDSLNSITAITFDSAGYMLVGLRAGDIYRLEDTDDDQVADKITLIFEDLDEEIGQVSGIFSQNEVLYIVNGRRLSQLRDTDNDGIYETVIQLSESLPANQALLQANNSIVRSSDGRYFTTNVMTGEILQLTLNE
jgi:hypothetical protein